VRKLFQSAPRIGGDQIAPFSGFLALSHLLRLPATTFAILQNLHFSPSQSQCSVRCFCWLWRCSRDSRGARTAANSFKPNPLPSSVDPGQIWLSSASDTAPVRVGLIQPLCARPLISKCHLIREIEHCPWHQGEGVSCPPFGTI
jgi:hypothetical protein